VRVAISLVLGFTFASSAAALEFTVVGDQAILSGNADGSELARIRDIASEHRNRIKVIVLRDIGGISSIQTLKAAAELITDHGWRTAVSGYCGGSCAYLFLGGVERHFTDDKPAGFTQVALGGTIVAEESTHQPVRYKGDPYNRGNFLVRPWIKKKTGDRLDEKLLDRILGTNARPRSGFLHFFPSTGLRRKDGVSVFACTGKEDPKTKWEQCEKIAGTDAYKEGIVTSSELVHSNDRPAAAQQSTKKPIQ
jgi:hypothetical protein